MSSLSPASKQSGQVFCATRFHALDQITMPQIFCLHHFHCCAHHHAPVGNAEVAHKVGRREGVRDAFPLDHIMQVLAG